MADKNTLKITILGCGDSAGVPRVGGDWGNCDKTNPKNRRTRPSIMVQSATTTLVVDTGPDFSQQLTRENIKTIDAVLYTHDHADHIAGIDDVRILAGRMNKQIPVYADERTLSSLKKRFDYIFEQKSSFYPAVVNAHTWMQDDMGREVTIGDISFTPFVQDHGQGNVSLGFRFGDVGYSTDMTNLDNKAINVLKGVKTWIADCADYSNGHGTLHAQFPTVQRLAKEIGAEQTYLTHLKMFYDYDVMNNELPEGFALCYDGLVILS